ncbi:MAG: glycosyltransferase family 4 protein [Actinomycetota bacterium]|nr:hypothetical protein [Actinomycetota bacterium]MCL6093043.1 hypothetical protein [Actinomycetota bacterium]MDA8167372.1 glycosyltransferase family 4 protein [Actinomycetota bacterium]
MTSVAFVSYQLKGHDGVSVESEKWIRIFREWGFTVHRIAGFIPGAREYDHIIPELDFLAPRIEAFTEDFFPAAGTGGGRDSLERELEDLAGEIGAALARELEAIAPDLLVAGNVFSLPLNIPMSVALCRFLRREKLACVAVHHDFYWQHARFAHGAMDALLENNFPPSMTRIRHVTVNRNSHDQLFRRTGINSKQINNCVDFDAVRLPDRFNARLRADLGIDDGETMFLQPTPAAPGRGIGNAIRFAGDFAAASGRPASLIISGPCEAGYEETFAQACRGAKARVRSIAGWLGTERNQDTAGSCYDIADAYVRADMVTFAGSRESFVSPVLSAVAYRKPLLVSGFPVLEELRALGFQFLPLDRHAVARAIKLLEHPALMQEMLDRNFAVGRKHFSLDVLRRDMEEFISRAPARTV